MSYAYFKYMLQKDPRIKEALTNIQIATGCPAYEIWSHLIKLGTPSNPFAVHAHSVYPAIPRNIFREYYFKIESINGKPV